MSNPHLIVGAGFAGLMAAHAFPDTPVIDAAPHPRQAHKALLRFRSKVVSELTGIPFTPVTVHKGIFSNERFVQPNISVCNAYAQKVVGALEDRSIWDIGTVQRWTAPENFYEMLLETVHRRICWGTTFNAKEFTPASPVITTAPLPVLLREFPVPSSDAALALTKAEHPIRVVRWRIEGSRVHQTIYFPDHDCSVYRASLCGDILIAESVKDESDPDDDNALLEQAFGMTIDNSKMLDVTIQSNGKLQGLPDRLRRTALCELTLRHKLYMLGRFATWRNVLLDDLVPDLAVIRRLLRADDYTLRKDYVQ